MSKPDIWGPGSPGTNREVPTGLGLLRVMGKDDALFCESWCAYYVTRWN